MAGDIRIGISGWTYAPWRGHFFPKKLQQKQELAFAAATFRSIEINGTFYGLQTPANFARWAEETPDDFVFAVKGPRFITHMKRLRDPEVREFADEQRHGTHKKRDVFVYFDNTISGGRRMMLGGWWNGYGSKEGSSFFEKKK